MNIWTGDTGQRPQVQGAFQKIIEEGLANSIYALIAWNHHKNDHMFISAINNLFLMPILGMAHSHKFPSTVEITTHDLRFFKMHGKEFKRAIGTINEILNGKGFVHVPKGSERYGPADPVLTVQVSIR